MPKNATTWSNNDVKSPTAWGPVFPTVKLYLYSDPTLLYNDPTRGYNSLTVQNNTFNGKLPASWTLKPKFSSNWTPATKSSSNWSRTGQANVPYLYDDATKNYDDPNRAYDYLTPIVNHTKLNPTQWAAT